MTALDALSREECGILLSLFVLGAEEAVLGRLGGARREACARAWQALQELGKEARAQVLAKWREAGTRVAPVGLERLHPSWIEASLAGEPPYVIQALLASGGLPEPVRGVVQACLHGCANLAPPSDAEVCLVAEVDRDEVLRHAVAREVGRMAFGWLAPLLESTCGPLAEELCTLPGDGLLDEVRRQGARALGHILAGEAPALRARVMAALGEPWASVILASSMDAQSPLDHALPATLASTFMPSWARSPRERLLSMGLAVLRPKLVAEDPGSPFRVAGRLPISLGLAMTGELEKHGHGLLVTGATRPGTNLG